MRRSAKVVGGAPSLNAVGGRDTVACRGDAASTSRMASCEAGFGPRQWGQGKHHEEEDSLAGAAAGCVRDDGFRAGRSEEHTSELQSLMRISYAVFCLKKKNNTIQQYMRIIMMTR